jgi:hypothetical protein
MGPIDQGGKDALHWAAENSLERTWDQEIL